MVREICERENMKEEKTDSEIVAHVMHELFIVHLMKK